jgi:hypothetical protein
MGAGEKVNLVLFRVHSGGVRVGLMVSYVLNSDMKADISVPHQFT